MNAMRQDLSMSGAKHMVDSANVNLMSLVALVILVKPILPVFLTAEGDDTWLIWLNINTRELISSQIR